MRLRAEKMITVSAGDNVVRLLPPLIVSEQKSPRASTPRSRLRAARAAHAQDAKRAGGGRMSGVRHFLDLIDVPAADLRR
jgi:hypothetical protein